MAATQSKSIPRGNPVGSGEAQSIPAVMVAGHICLDIIPSLTHGDGGVLPGALVHVGPATVSTGGAVANTGLALHRLGVKTRLIARVGDDLFGRGIRELIRRHGADDGAFVTDPGEATSYTIVINPPGIDRSFLHCPGVNDRFEVEAIGDEQLRGMRLLHFGYPPLMRRVYNDGGTALMRLLARARRLGVTTSLDMCAPDPKAESGRVDWLAFLKRVLPQVDMFAPSLDELAVMMGRAADPCDLDEVRKLAEATLELGPAMLCIKMGMHGLLAAVTSSQARLQQCGAAQVQDMPAWRGRASWTPCFKVNVAGTTGAGDTTVAGIIAALLQGAALPDMLTFAVAVGACCVEQPDAVSGIPDAATVRGRISAGWPQLPHAPLASNWQHEPKRGHWSTSG